MGAKQSSAARARAFSSGGPDMTSNGGGVAVSAGSNANGESSRSRTRSLGSFHQDSNGHPSVLQLGARATVPAGNSTPGTTRVLSSSRHMQAQSLPLHLLAFNAGIKCPVCSKFIQSDDIEYHLVMCLTKPRIHYNEDVLSDNKGECVICLDELEQGHTIARLPCLCIYHKACIDKWFKKNRSCPEHPSD